MKKFEFISLIFSSLITILSGINDPNNKPFLGSLAETVALQTTPEGLIGFKWILEREGVREITLGFMVTVILLLLVLMLLWFWLRNKEDSMIDVFCILLIANILPFGLTAMAFNCFVKPVTTPEFIFACIVSALLLVFSIFLLRASFMPLMRLLRELIYG